MPARNARVGASLTARPDPQDAARGAVTEVQRARMLAAAVEVVSDVGYPGMSVARVITRAGVSRRTFYDLFVDREDCFLAAFEEAVIRAAAVVVPPFNTEGRWRERVRAALTALLVFFDEEPGMRALLVVDALAAGPRALERRARVVAALIAAVDEGRSEVKGAQPPPLTAEGVVGSVSAIVHTRAQERSPKPLAALTGQLVGMIVLPYLGPAAAAKETARPQPPARRARTRPAKDPLDGLDMRLTYRTLRVLAAISERPDINNREAATAAGVSDQGQISKLLARLENLGLIFNSGAGQPKGAPNAWRLTPRGAEVQRAIQGSIPHMGDGERSDS